MARITNPENIGKDLEGYMRIVALTRKLDMRITDWNIDPISDVREPEIEIESWPGKRHWYSLKECAEALADRLEEKLTEELGNRIAKGQIGR